VSIYTARLGAFEIASAPGGWNSVFTVPNDGNTYVLRDIVLQNQSGASALLVAGIEVSGLTSEVWVLGGTAVAASSILTWQGRQVLLPGDVLQVYVAAGNAAACLFTGYKLA
jgi:hypothetical protein